MNRRDFVRTTAAAGAALAAPAAVASAALKEKKAAAPALIKAPRLQAGDTVGVVLPASHEFETHELGIGTDQVRALGFEPKLGAHAAEKHGYFAGTDEARAADINAMFADPKVKGMFASGGWGSPRVLPLLDYEMIRRNPKVLIGFSDVTALLNTVHQRTGLVTFHGPSAFSNFDPWTIDNLKRAVMSPDPIGTISNPPKPDSALIQRRFRTYTIRGGRASGTIVGGNLTLLAALMGTPYEIETDGAILFIEEVREAIYRVDRMLTQLSLGGKFARLAGVVFGYCSECPADRGSFSLEEVLRDHFTRLGVPAFAGLAFGHIDQKLTLPIGLRATMDADAGTVTIAEGAVV
ncbi:MAG TPA: LD-carboxypeptidase [Thermoanaerobaculia bacterium]|nr:LD-carboxypeptidase [Thermoanaerobaculia bacterium]